MTLAQRMQASAAAAAAAKTGGETTKRPLSAPLSPPARPSKQPRIIEIGTGTGGPAAGSVSTPADKGKGQIFVPAWDVTVKDSFATNTEVGLKVMRELSKLDPDFAALQPGQHLTGVFENLTRSLRSTYDLILKDQARIVDEGALRTRANNAESRLHVVEREAAEARRRLEAERAEHAKAVLDFEEKVRRLEAEKVRAGDEALASYKFTRQFYDDAAPLIACCNRQAYGQALEHIKTRQPGVVVTGLHYGCSRVEVGSASEGRCPTDVSLPEPEPIDGPFEDEEVVSGGTSHAPAAEGATAPAEEVVTPLPEVQNV